MIGIKVPLRMSFVGGGSDIASFYSEHGWAVVSSSINKYIYININPKFDHKIRFSYSKTEIIDSINEMQHDLAKAIIIYAYDFLNEHSTHTSYKPEWFEIISIADIPSEWSGLGSSSAFTVALLQALYAYNNKFVSAETLAEQACEIEIKILGKPIGKQDQYASAHGGFNFIEFFPDGTVSVQPIIFSKETKRKLESKLLMFYTGITRKADTILGEQTKNIGDQKDKIEGMKKMVKIAYELKKELEENNEQRFGELLHENRLLKKEMAWGISNPQIDQWYDSAIQAGATGGKLLGAGGWGFFIFYAPEDKHEKIKSALSDLRYIPFSFENGGSQVIFYQD